MPIRKQIYAAGLFRRRMILQSAFIIDKKSVLPAAGPNSPLANCIGTISAIQIQDQGVWQRHFSPFAFPLLKTL